MSEIRSALIVGAGIGGMSAAIRLRSRGIAVDLVERDPDWRVYGAGISITGPTLRAFGELGVLDEVLADGAFGNGIRFCMSDGQTVGTVPLPRVAGATVPAAGGILRPALHAILSRRTLGAGAAVRLGLSAAFVIEQQDDVLVGFSDGSRASYDVVIAADGARSAMRAMLFPEAPALTPTGQGCWRVNAPRPAEIDQATFYIGRSVRVGLVPISARQLYLFCLTPTGSLPEKIPEAELVGRLRHHLEAFGGVVAGIRDGLTPETVVNYRPLEAMLVSRPWHRGRVALLGDAAHATTPHLASGAGIAVEDAIVLADTLAGASDIETALRQYADRRFERCRLVVENSLALGRMQLDGAPDDQFQHLMAVSAKALAEPV